jgi:hypothetical protein
MKGMKMQQPPSSSLWSKSAIALLWGLVLSVSLMVNLYNLLPLSGGARILIGVLTGFSTWAGIMVYCYSRTTVAAACRGCLPPTLLSVGFNLLTLLPFVGN